jgi:hypothetical protein
MLKKMNMLRKLNIAVIQLCNVNNYVVVIRPLPKLPGNCITDLRRKNNHCNVNFY